ncbi:LacI family DNA-binding transcriptional regulator [Actinospica sp. MGRD01-02]|uniref:LacI family DNA-binding transcriptional regulator n=1 Tax=Actinospica acidithermotolerans TaxID=2828514 RepID=A0A941E9V1_9ACTN|nr:LacI family DNA-binding transcriptional regulator [Actinospica acidithermotolerans]MBR7826507.1 LacI family DNA-binding transcriptional regulator [Actinospica acidithermotolerans]
MDEQRSRAAEVPAGRVRPVTGAVTLKQVAAEAEVSLATASRVLHRSGGREVRGALAERVQAAAERLGYVSNPHAQALARARSSTVGLIVHDVTDPYFAAIATGAMHAAHADGVMVMMAATFRDPELEIDYLGRLRAQGARGALLAGSGSTDPAVSGRLADAITAFTREGGRVTAIGARPDAHIDAVVPDNTDGARQARAHLEALGHRRIGVVSGPGTLLTVRQRLEGLGDGLRTVEADFTREGGYEAAAKLLAAHPDGGLTALIALNDLMAAGALAAARDAGRRVPEDLSVVGFDDLPFAADLSPALTTVRLPLRQMGERAMALLLTGSDGASPAAGPSAASAAEPGAAASRRTVDFPVELVVRASTAEAAGARTT